MLPAGAIMAALAGALLGFPVLRMHGDYLAIVTLGFGEIIRLVLNNWVSFTGGPNGVSVPAPTQIASALREQGVEIEGSVYTTEQLLAALLKLKKEVGRNA